MQSIMRTEVIQASSIDEAAEVILKKLREEDPADTSRHNAIYFDGWDGLGASAVLQAVGGRLTAAASSSQDKEPGGLKFSHIFHINCSKWESRRAMQRVIAEQVKLPPSVMEILDAQDEEDDYQGVAKGCRIEIPQVTEAIYQTVQKLIMNGRFLVLFLNGSNQEVDLNSFGFPLSAYFRNKVLWSFQGRFRIYPKMKVDAALKNARMTDTLLSAGSSTDVPEHMLSNILRQEAEVAAREMVNSTIGGIDWPAMASSYFLYMMKLYGMGNHINDYGMSTHGCNYWKCDNGMTLLQPLGDVDSDDGADRLWLSADALHREMQLDEDYYQYLSSPVERSLHKRMAYWTSPTYGFMVIPDPNGQIPKGMFQQYDKLCVLKLSACEFSFTSPPFLCCNNLRFLWLDHCQDGTNATEEAKEDDICQFFQRLWVLDVRYPNKVFLSSDMLDSMTQLKELSMVGNCMEYIMNDYLFQRQMHKIRRLRLKDCYCPTLLSGMDKMELFEYSNKNTSWGTFSIESNCSLETVIIKSFFQCVLSFMGCAKLKNIFLSGSFPELYTINITGAAVETLDLSAVTAPLLHELVLRECGELCSILWPAEEGRKIYLDKLHMDTTRAGGTAAAATGRVFDFLISVRDARILRSLEHVKDYFSRNHAHVEVSTPTHLYGDATFSKGNQISRCEQLKGTAVYADVILTSKAIDEGDSSDAPMRSYICPPPPDVPSKGCYLHIGDQLRTKSQANSSIITISGFICDGTKILHIHNSLHITCILAAPTASAVWNELEWCRVEGCPKLECVFSTQLGAGRPERPDSNILFNKLRTTWVSDLPSARYIWKCIGSSTTIDNYKGQLFGDLTLLHLDCCPNLIQIVHLPNFGLVWDRLERLEILWCSELSVAFHSGTPYVSSASIDSSHIWEFPKLKHVCLHELPKLENIRHIGKIYMPELETIKIRGCWSLRTLPIIERANIVECDCEKEWWDQLEWDSKGHADNYKPNHPRYYKNTMLRGSVLS